MKHKVLAFTLLCVLLCSTLSSCGSTSSASSDMTQLLKILFHEPYLEIADMKTNCDSSREKTIPKIEKALKGEQYLLKQETGFFSNYFAVTSQNSTCAYYGDIKDNRPHGFGVVALLTSDGELSRFVYAGEFKKGQYDGYGIEFHHTYAQYATEDSDVSELLLTYVNNYIIYDGEWNSGSKHGEGNQYHIPYGPQGNSIEGYWAGLSYPDVSIGEWKLGSQTGDFKIYDANVLIYDGHMKNGKADGEGTSYYPNGEVQYKGDWEDGEYDGKGTLYDEAGNKVYSGKWKSGDYAS